jgi:uncharacterized protein YecT (DUF1311 family)
VWSRWFWKITNKDEARRLVKTTSATFFALSALQAAVSIILMVNTGDQIAYSLSGEALVELLLTSILFAFFAFALWYWSSRFVALTLLILSISVVVTGLSTRLGTTHGHPNIFFALIAVWAGVRATEATFKLRGRFAEAGNPRESETAPPRNEDQTSRSARANPSSQKPFDAERWNALLKYDLDIAKVADQLRPFGEKWVDVFAREYLILNDKQYLPQIIPKIIEDAKLERANFAHCDADTHFAEDPSNTDFQNNSGGDKAAFASEKERQAAGPPLQYEPLKAGRSRNYIARHWRGELSLPVSYWVNGLLGNVLAIIAVVAISRGFDFRDEFDPRVALLTITLIWAVTFAIALWQLVGNWRSATNYQQIKGFWGGAAKFAVVIGATRLAVAFWQTGIPQLHELVQIYQGDARLGSHAFQVIRDGKGLRFTGGITFGVAKEFEGFLKAMPNVKLIQLDSVGGRVYEAARISALIRARGLDTRVSRQCMSACTTIFLSGRERTVSSRAQLGFHQPDFPGLTDDERAALVLAEKKRLQQQGVTQEFAEKAISAPPASMWFPTAPELIAGRVVTMVTDRSPLAPSVTNSSNNLTFGQQTHGASNDQAPLDDLSRFGDPVDKADGLVREAVGSPTAALPDLSQFGTPADKPKSVLEAHDRLEYLARTNEQPSFDCKKASQPIERIICADADLALWDNRLGVAFRTRAAQLAPPIRRAFVRSQVEWINLRNYKCDIPSTWAANDIASVKPCLVLTTTARIHAIEAGAVP